MTPDESTQAAAMLPAGQDIFCPGCGYNVRGLPENRCPECGRAFDPAVLAVSQLPWPQRHAIGRLRAYWRTVFFVMFRNRRFSDEFAYPVSYHDANLFRWITVAHASVISVALIICIIVAAPSLVWKVPLISVLSNLWVMVGGLFGTVLAFAAMTGLPGYFFHPHRLTTESQNRAVALSYYTCAPLVFSPLLTLIVVLLEFLDCGPASLLIGFIALMLLLLVWLRLLLRLAKYAVRPTLEKQIVMAVLLPIVWPLVAFVVLFGTVQFFRFVASLVLSLLP